MAPRCFPQWLPLTVFITFYIALAGAVSGQEPLKAQEQGAYRLGQAIPVSCLNRTMCVLRSSF